MVTILVNIFGPMLEVGMNQKRIHQHVPVIMEANT